MRSLGDLQRSAGTPAPAGPARLPVDAGQVRTFDTPEFAGMRFLEVEAKTALNRVHGMPFKWSINPYRGCSHACAYCFARPSHAYLNLSPGEDFEQTVVVKTNVAQVLRREVAKPTWTGEPVAMGTNTDPYQRCEGRYRLMPDIIGALADYRTPFSILTKGTLVTRDLGALAAAGEQVEVTCALTIGMLDEGLWRASEPGTPSPRARLDAVRALNDAGVPTGVMLAPIMPDLNDDAEQLAALVDACAEAGATHITPIVLHLRGGGGAGKPPAWMSVREVFIPWLASYRPDLVERYEARYTGAYAAADYRGEVEAFVAARRREAWRRHGRSPGHGRSLRRAEREAPRASGAAPTQLPLW